MPRPHRPSVRYAGPHGEHAPRRAHRRYGDKARWYLPLALATDALGVALPALFVLTLARQPHPLVCALVAAAAWICVRALRRRYAAGLIGEARGALPVLGDWLALIGVLAVLHTACGEVAEPSLALAGLTAGPLFTLAGRVVTHRHLISARRSAQAVRRVLVIGEPGTVDDVVGHLAARTEHAYVVVGVVPVGGAEPACGAPVAGRLGPVDPRQPGEDASVVLGAVRELGAERVLVAPGPLLSAQRLRRLSWALHDSGVPVAVLPGLVDVAVRRVQLDAAAGLVLLHIAPPTRRGPQVVLKAAVDRVGAAFGLLLLAPLFAVIALAVRGTSPGPVFHRQTRCGRNGRPFTLWKFRTMVVDAEARKDELSAANENDGPMFKMRRDPRVTGVGRLLRRCSLDELPQLLNVLTGDMSLVGPRPPLPDEVARYNEVELRRLTVRPGLTGLWQISGRSELSWDETLQLDLRYVDNWSFTTDLDVMARTPRAVVDGRGAY
ncbi:sugar transferase [Streptomyces sp.]|uniref:sugar transferase n=1 Tax=Streptomyces sp. TaxID=1931 RepID=UPI002F400EAC